MNRRRAWMLLCILVVGCEQQYHFVIDFSQAEDFDWDGKVRLTKTRRTRLGPFLTHDVDWDVDRIEFLSRDGRSASIDTRGYRETPVASIDVGKPQELRILGTKGFWDGNNSIVFILDPNFAREMVEASAATQPATQPAKKTYSGMGFRGVSEDLRPYAEHVDQLELVDWWAIALQEANDVMMEFRVPKENVRIVLRGDPDQFGPAVLEVWTTDGRCLKRIEQQQVPVHPFDPNQQPTIGSRSANDSQVH